MTKTKLDPALIIIAFEYSIQLMVLRRNEYLTKSGKVRKGCEIYHDHYSERIERFNKQLEIAKKLTAK